VTFTVYVEVVFDSTKPIVDLHISNFFSNNIIEIIQKVMIYSLVSLTNAHYTIKE